MDVYEIERHLIAGKPYNSDDVIDSLIEKLKEVSGKYEQITEVLYELDLSDDASILEDELRTIFYDWDCDRTEIKTLQNDINVLKETFANP
jgi:hypothetical protein